VKSVRLCAFTLLLTLLMASLGYSKVSAGAVDGPRQMTDRCVPARSCRKFYVRFSARATARVRAYAGCDDQDIDMEIYDAQGNLVVSDHEPDSEPVCAWYPKREGLYAIKIINREDEPVDFDLCTN
jgi:hypothetical protein